MDMWVRRTIFLTILLYQFNRNLGSDMIPKELFEGIELIAATKGTKYQFSSLQKVERSFVKKFIKHFFVDLGTFKNKRPMY